MSACHLHAAALPVYRSFDRKAFPTLPPTPRPRRREKEGVGSYALEGGGAPACPPPPVSPAGSREQDEEKEEPQPASASSALFITVGVVVAGAEGGRRHVEVGWVLVTRRCRRRCRHEWAGLNVWC